MSAVWRISIAAGKSRRARWTAPGCPVDRATSSIGAEASSGLPRTQRKTPGAAVIRAALEGTGGYATLVARTVRNPRVRAGVRAAVRPLMRITAGMKASFDPAAFSTPAECTRAFESPGAGITDADQFRAEKLKTRRCKVRRRSSAPACIADFARRPARPTCCWATNWTARAGAST